MNIIKISVSGAARYCNQARDPGWPWTNNNSSPAPLTTQCGELFKLALRLVAYDNIAKDMMEEVDIEDEASIIATPAASLTSEDDASDPDDISTGEEDSLIPTPVVTFDIPPPPEQELNSFFNSIDFEDEEASFISTPVVTFDIPPPPEQEQNSFFNSIDFEEDFEDLLENIELQELPAQIFEDPELDDPESTIDNTEDKLLCFSMRCMQRGLYFSQSDIILDLEEIPSYDEEDVFKKECTLTIFPIERSYRNRIFYPSTEREEDELEFRRNLLEDFPI